MGLTQINIVVTVVFFVLTYISGYWLNKNEQPFNVVVLTVHKLLTLALIVYLVVIVLGINKLAPLSRVELTACVVTALLFLGAVASGGILSTVKTMPEFVRMLHKLLSALTFLSTAVTFYLLVRRQ